MEGLKKQLGEGGKGDKDNKEGGGEAGKPTAFVRWETEKRLTRRVEKLKELLAEARKQAAEARAKNET